MKVLFVTRKFPPSVGGMERYAADLYKAIGQQSDVKLVKWGGSNKWLPIVLPWLFVSAFWKLLTNKLDVIHMQDGVLSPLGWLLKIVFRKPLVVVVHGLDVTYKLPFYQRIIPWFLRRADKVICISNAARDEVAKRGVGAEKTVVIPLGVGDYLFTGDREGAREQVCSEFKLDSKATKILLAHGRLVKRKGVAWFINNVMPKLVEDTSFKVVLMISGDGEDRSAVEQAVAQQNLQDSVFILGRTSDDLRQQLYNASDVFVMPNIVVPGDMEGFGIVLIEAALCKLPIVASGIEGIKDAIADDKNGVLVESENVKEFVAAIQNFLKNERKARAFGEKARGYSLDTYNWDKIGQRFIKEYEFLTQ